MSSELRQKLCFLRDQVVPPLNLKDYAGTVLPSRFDDYKDRIENFEVRDDDIWVASFPKSGTTWTQEMVWLVVNNCDYEGAKELLELRYGFIELLGIISSMVEDVEYVTPDPVHKLDNTTGRRFIKTHLPWDLLPLQIRNGTKKPKIIYVIRDVKDVVVSWFHHAKVFKETATDLHEFFKLFLTDNYKYSPYWGNILSFWNNRHLPNILILQYEDMIRDLPSVIHKTASFLETSVPEEKMEKLLRHLSFGEMKKNAAVNMERLTELFNKDVDDKTSFIRKGKVGGYKEELTREMVELLDLWSKMNTEGTEFRCNI
ncbi:hypothetical protein Trydic_g19237 [Trypoxylus dichotomus]